MKIKLSVPNNLCKYLTLKEVLKCAPHMVNLLLGVEWKEVGRNSFIVEKPDIHDLSQVIKVNISSEKSC